MSFIKYNWLTLHLTFCVRLRDGRSIHTVSALLLQLVQTSAHDVRLKAKRVSLNRQQSFVMKPESQSAGQRSLNEPFLNDRDYEVKLSSIYDNFSLILLTRRFICTLMV